jgi:hypothetical protein
MSDHPKYAKALAAVQDLFADMSVGPETTRAALSALSDEIEGLIDTLPEDGGA